MKRILTILLLACCATSVAAQSVQLGDFIEHLTARGAKVSTARVNDKYHLSRRYNVTFENDLPLADSICILLDRLAR